MGFDEQYVVNLLESSLKKEFNTKTWKELFGGNAIKFSDDNFGASNVFPLIYIAVENSFELEKTIDSSLEENYTKFSFAIEQYNVGTNKSDKRNLGILINSAIMKVLKQTLNPVISENKRVASPDNNIYRRLIEGYCTINNKSKIFYRR